MVSNTPTTEPYIKSGFTADGSGIKRFFIEAYSGNKSIYSSFLWFEDADHDKDFGMALKFLSQEFYPHQGNVYDNRRK